MIWVSVLFGGWSLGDWAVHQLVDAVVVAPGPSSGTVRLVFAVLLGVLSVLFVFAIERLVGSRGAMIVAASVLVVALFQLVAGLAWDLGSSSGTGYFDVQSQLAYLSQMVAMCVALPGMWLVTRRSSADADS